MRLVDSVPLLTLPVELICHILGFLEIADLVQCTEVNILPSISSFRLISFTISSQSTCGKLSPTLRDFSIT